jgi:hypothetical protein
LNVGEEIVRSIMRSRPAVHVAIPSYGAVPAMCMLSFASFCASGATWISRLGQVDGAYIDRSRNDLVRQALANDATHLMFIDQDMIIPENALNRLLLHGVPIVGGSYWGKDDWFTPVAFHLDPFDRIYELEDCESVPSSVPLPEGVDDCWCGKPDPHLHKVGGTGMGCTLIQTQVFLDMREHFEDELWFSSKETGEDVHFATRAKEMGLDRFLDGFIQCGHVRHHMVTRGNYYWARQSAPKCGIEGCERTARWDVREPEAAESADRCRIHRDD